MNQSYGGAQLAVIDAGEEEKTKHQQVAMVEEENGIMNQSYGGAHFAGMDAGEQQQQDGADDEQQHLQQLLSSVSSLAPDQQQSFLALIHLSRFQPQRHKLASLHALPRLISTLSHFLSLLGQSSLDACTSAQNSSFPAENLKHLLLLLKLLRNLCAGEASNQQAFLDSNGVESVALVFEKPLSGFLDAEFQSESKGAPGDCSVSSCSIPPEDGPNLRNQTRSCIIDIFQMALQLLGNFSGGGEAYKEAVWKRCVPSVFTRLALTREDRILEPICMVLYTCCQGSKDRLMDLCHGGGASLFSVCLRTVITADVFGRAAGEWLYHLVSQVCLREPFFPLLFSSLGDPSISGTLAMEELQFGAEAIFSSEQTALLDMLCFLLGEEEEEVRSTGLSFEQQGERNLPMPSESIACLVEIIRRAAKLSNPGSSLHMKLPTGIPSIDVLGYALQIARILSIWECVGRQGVDTPPKLDNDHTEDQRSSVIAELSSNGLIKLCIELLQELGPPETVCRAMKQEGKINLAAEDRVETNIECNANRICGTNLPSTLGRVGQGEVDLFKLNLAEEYRARKAPYQGCRRDLVAIIGNASHQNRAVQDEVRQLGGLILILQQCVVDEENPFLREWGLWAVRNLLEGNGENCKELSDMQLKGSFTPIELVQMGMKVEMDPLTGRPKLVNASS